MPFFLSQRAGHLRERMDDPDSDLDELINTYRQFEVINAAVSRWSRIYRSIIRPSSMNKNRPVTLLDIGFGGGDIPLKLARWAREDQIKMDITAIDTDERAFNYVQSLEKPDNISFHLCSSSELCRQGKTFDIVISNHLLHHLPEPKLLPFLEEAETLSIDLVLFNDLERSDLAYALFNVLSRPVFRSSFITEDGLSSIKRSYTKEELLDRVPGRWSVRRLFPFRLLLSFRHS